jgi:hypothetical protein
MTIPTDLLATAEAWVSTPTYEEELDYLLQRPELLDERFDLAVEETLLKLNDQAAERYRNLRAVARETGDPRTAYRPMLLGLLAQQFVEADPALQHQLLRERRDDLLHDAVLDLVQQRAEGDDATSDDQRALALLRVAQAASEDLLDQVFAATSQPEQVADLLSARTHQQDTTLLGEIASLALHAALNENHAANAAFHFAVAAAIDGNTETASVALREARAMEPSLTATWISQLAEYGTIHPAVLSLIPVLTETITDADQ